MSQVEWSEIVERALREDGTYSDVTTLTFVPEEVTGVAEILSRIEGVVCGVAAAEEVFKQCGPGIQQKWWVKDGDHVTPNQPWVQLSGRLRPILTGERTALNFLTHLSGIATLSARFVEAIAGTNCVIRDTRKTLPGLRDAEKYAVRCGGAENHRTNLASAGLIKENHLVAAGGLQIVLDKLRTHKKNGSNFELEVETIDELKLALEANTPEILLDNFTVEQTIEAVKINNGRAILESSGGVTLENVASYARTGVDRISIGALTHSAKPLDLTLLVRHRDAMK